MADETVLLASFIHESNTFVTNPKVTDREDFRARREYFGDDVIKNLQGTETGIGGVTDIAETEDVELCPVLAASATPGAPIEEETYEFYVEKIINGVQEHVDDINGVILPLHGAMVPEHKHDGEGPLISRVREVVGPDIPISVTLDLHGNVTEEMMTGADSLVGFKEYPHLDKRETGQLGMNTLLETIRGNVDPVMHIERPPQIIYQPKAYTQSGPIVKIIDRARDANGNSATMSYP